MGEQRRAALASMNTAAGQSMAHVSILLLLKACVRKNCKRCVWSCFLAVGRYLVRFFSSVEV